tara:strand:- start:494 stop:715 length:222 start_codon:yes stop_codon:yes gene_type:complete
MKFDNNIKLAIILFCSVAFGLYYLKPQFAFNPDGTFKQFGLSKDRTIYPFWLVVSVVGIVIYLCIIVKKDEYI